MINLIRKDFPQAATVSRVYQVLRRGECLVMDTDHCLDAQLTVHWHGKCYVRFQRLIVNVSFHSCPMEDMIYDTAKNINGAFFSNNACV